MKKAILIALLLASCADTPKDKVKELSDWIVKAKKPVIVKLNVMNGWNSENDYTLIDSTGAIYVTGMMRVNLPDTIK